MANFQIDSRSLDSLIASIQDAGIFTDAVQEKMLIAGSEKLMETIRSEAANSSFRLERISSKLSRSRKIKRDKNGNNYMTVSVSGNNERGERNATVAFVLNYGRSETFGKITGSYFWTRAVQKASKSVLPVYEEIVNRELTERGLI